MHTPIRKEAIDPRNPPLMETDWIKRKYLNIPYIENASKNQYLDIYLPDDGSGPFPLIIFIHGGAFIGGDKSDFQCEYVINGIERGYAVASLNHRFSNEATFPYPLFDIKAAVRFLRANAGVYSFDPRRFAAVGASAGAYFAAMLATTPGIPVFEDQAMGNSGIDSSVQAVVGMFGVYDLAQTSAFSEQQKVELGTSALFNYCDMFTGVKASECQNLMPLIWPGSYITENCPPFLIQAGTADRIVPYDNSVAIANKINLVCGKDRAILEPFLDCNHGDPSFGSNENKERILNFLDTVLK